MKLLSHFRLQTLLGVLPLLLLLLSCKKDKDDANPSKDISVWVRTEANSQWAYGPSTTLPGTQIADNYPFVGAVIGISKKSQLVSQPMPEYRQQLNMDSLWANGLGTKFQTDTTFRLSARSGEAIYLTIACPQFHFNNSQMDSFRGALKSFVEISVQNGGNGYTVAGCNDGLFNGGTFVSTANYNKQAMVYTGPDNRPWVMVENSCIIP